MLLPTPFAFALGFAVSVGQYFPTVFAGGERFPLVPKLCLGTRSAANSVCSSARGSKGNSKETELPNHLHCQQSLGTSSIRNLTTDIGCKSGGSFLRAYLHSEHSGLKLLTCSRSSNRDTVCTWLQQGLNLSGRTLPLSKWVEIRISIGMIITCSQSRSLVRAASKECHYRFDPDDVILGTSERPANLEGCPRMLPCLTSAMVL